MAPPSTRQVPLNDGAPFVSERVERGEKIRRTIIGAGRRIATSGRLPTVRRARNQRLEEEGTVRIRKKKVKETSCRTFCGFDVVGIEATKGLPLPNDLSVFVSRLTHQRGPRETELLLSLSLSLSLAGPFFPFVPFFSLSLFLSSAGG